MTSYLRISHRVSVSLSAIFKMNMFGQCANHKREKMAKHQNKEAEEIRISCALDFLGCLITAPQARCNPARIKLYILYLHFWCWTFRLYLVHSGIFPSICLKLSCKSIYLVFFFNIYFSAWRGLER